MKERFLESLAILLAGLFSAERSKKAAHLADVSRSVEHPERERSDFDAEERAAEEHPQN
jgi:hypothetical protein